jgi:hypothetical protein
MDILIITSRAKAIESSSGIDIRYKEIEILDS